MAISLEYIRKRLGWCPNADSVKRLQRTSKAPGYEDGWKGSPSGPDPEPSGSAGEDAPGYQENMLLILLALIWLFPIAYQREFLPIVAVLSAVAMYVDAQNIRAGSGFAEETLLGNIVTWRPLTWGAATLVGGVIIMAIYLFYRKEISTANRGGGARE